MAKRKRPTNDDSLITPFNTPTVYKSKQIEDEDSTFVGHFIPLHSLVEDVTAQIRYLRAMPHVKGASHHTVAWRLKGDSGHDDDGERWAGSRIEQVMRKEKVQFGVLMVSRWFGGTMLGPRRFQRIEECAHEAVQKWKDTQAKAPPSANETAELAKARNLLRSKDMTIQFLRQKIQDQNARKGLPTSPVKGSPLKEKYDQLPMESLQRQLVARDATIKSLREIASPQKPKPVAPK